MITSLSSCGSNTFTDARDGNSYEFVKIGEQTWMAENLKYTGEDIKHITDTDEWGHNDSFDAWCSYENNQENEDKYGVMYQWEAAKKACPDGWHLPTKEEWEELIDYLKANGYSNKSMLSSSGVAKSLATADGWELSEYEGEVGSRDYPEYQNKSGFSALPGGEREGRGRFSNLGKSSVWWSISDHDDFVDKCIRLVHSESHVRGYMSNHKRKGYYVRCIKDNPTDH
ncbi:MAG: FISUMP domain-containing protein [Crocinitomicaceae bacterium]|nr:FISUMP domain-containing protein [Crocinitomicaceae bacterium]MDG1776179.1 FISUMP domain-containing protein [Crocinitomicaceae bacterium]